ncbi:hypothetical protein BDV96DRAFT_581187 [Lophiotrema nucula]|uniref:Protein kinase domain-containing protein n=1 Tax=Lophiotrema nucula TaxID=690887 RepID=A0A6A5YZV1_9PLEO|nr:hypothetical protein BDV96DRAFT_581187 [Lophiotrema nucula]
MDASHFQFNNIDFSNMNYLPVDQQSFAKPEGDTSAFFFGDEGIDTTTAGATQYGLGSAQQSFESNTTDLFPVPQSGFDMQHTMSMDNTLGSASWSQMSPQVNDFVAPTPMQSFASPYPQYSNALGKRPLQLDTQDFPQPKRLEFDSFSSFAPTTSVTGSSWTMETQPTPSSCVELGLSDEAVDVCSLWFSKYAVLPSDRQIDALGQLTGEPVEAIRQWFGKLCKQGFSGHDSAYKSQTASFTQQEPLINNTISSELAATACSHDNTQATQPVLRGGRKGCTPVSDPLLLARDPSKIYQCTRKCGKRYGRKCDWKRNEEEGYPSKSWICSLCRNSSADKVKPCFRRYHFAQHFKNIHPGLDCEDFEEDSIVHTDTTFPRRCGFCPHRFTTRQDRIDHIADHFKKGKCMLDWNDDEDNTDDDNMDDDDKPDNDGFDDNSPSSGPSGNDGPSGPGPKQDGSGSGGYGGGGYFPPSGFMQFQLSGFKQANAGGEVQDNNSLDSSQRLQQRTESDSDLTDQRQNSSLREVEDIHQKSSENCGHCGTSVYYSGHSICRAILQSSAQDDPLPLAGDGIAQSLKDPILQVPPHSLTPPPPIPDDGYDSGIEFPHFRKLHDQHPGDGKKCPITDCQVTFKNLRVHLLSHQNQRPEKCPIETCEYHVKGFNRKYDQVRHTLTHYTGDLVCGFCPSSKPEAEKSFNRADIYKRHLASVHGAEQSTPASRLQSRLQTRSSRGANECSGDCSTCPITFTNIQEFYEHLEGCIMTAIQRQNEHFAVNTGEKAPQEAPFANHDDLKSRDHHVGSSLNVDSHDNTTEAIEGLQGLPSSSGLSGVQIVAPKPLSLLIEDSNSVADVLTTPKTVPSNVGVDDDLTTAELSKLLEIEAVATSRLHGVDAADNQVSSQIDIPSSQSQTSRSFLSVRLLGAGGFSTVDEVVHRKTNLRVSRKTLKNRQQSAIAEVKKEVGVLQKLRHPHIIRFLGAYSQGDKVSILLSPVAETTLALWLERCYVEKPTGLAATIAKMYGCLASSVRYLHEQRPVVKHMDIKPANILIVNGNTDHPHVVLCDFGISSSEGLTDDIIGDRHQPLTRQYCAPEVPGGFAREQAADIWSLGCVFLEMAIAALSQTNAQWHGFRDEFCGCEGKCYWENVAGLQAWLAGFLDETTNDLETLMLHTVKQMLSGEPTERPDAASLTMIFAPAPCCLSWPNEKVSYPGPVEELSTAEMLVQEDGVDCLAQLKLCRGSEHEQDLDPFLRAKSWLQECSHDHDACQHQVNGKSSLPTRLLDTQPDGIGGLSVRVMNTADILSSAEATDYAVVSHVWSETDLKLSDKLLQTTQGDLLRATLPRAVNDAITTASRVGYRYLWVDSLCVRQDSEEEKQRECGAMASVYRNASLTIVVDKHDKLDPTLPWYNSGDTAWDTRIWGLQERFLSRRLLRISGEQLYWECNALKASETFPHGLPSLVWEKVHTKSTSTSLPTSALKAEHVPRPGRYSQFLKKEEDHMKFANPVVKTENAVKKGGDVKNEWLGGTAKSLGRVQGGCCGDGGHASEVPNRGCTGDAAKDAKLYAEPEGIEWEM